MRRYLLSTTCGMIAALCAASSDVSAQNYMPISRYENPGIVVNMDVLGGASSVPMPIMMQDLQAPSAQGQKPLALIPPSQKTASQPSASGQAVPDQVMDPVGQPESRSIASTKHVPSSVMTPQPFSAGAMAASAPPVPQKAPDPKPPMDAGDYAEAEVNTDEMMIAAAPPVSQLKALDAPDHSEEVVSSEDANPARQLLARAREEAQQDEGHEESVVTWDMASAEAAAPIAPVPTSAPSAQTALRVDDMEAFRVVFDAEADELKASEQDVLDTMIAQLQADPDARLQIRAYAQGTPDTAAQARRLSLARALAVRTYVLAKGVPAPRLDVRALGIGSAAMGDLNGRSDVPSDRADLVLVR